MNITLTSGNGTASSSSSSSNNHISWQGHSFQPMTFRIMNAICEVCRRSCSDLRSPPPALECIRCRMRIHRNHVENHEKFVVCPNTVKQWIIRAPSSNDRNAWIYCINQLKKEALTATVDGLLSPGPLNKVNNAPSTPLPVFNTLRYRSMRNFAGLKDITSRRSVAVTFPRQNSTSSVPGSATMGTIFQSPLLSSPPPPPTVATGTATSQMHTTPNFDGQHDL